MVIFPGEGWVDERVTWGRGRSHTKAHFLTCTLKELEIKNLLLNQLRGEVVSASEYRFEGH